MWEVADSVLVLVKLSVILSGNTMIFLQKNPESSVILDSATTVSMLYSTLLPLPVTGKYPKPSSFRC